MDHAEKHRQITLDQFTRQAPEYSRLTRSLASDRSAALRESLGIIPDDVVLEVACGPGSLTLDLAPHVRHATGIDLTPAMLAEARTAQAARGGDNIDWLEADAAALPFADGSFTLVACRAAFHHFAEPARVLGEMVRVCRPGGRVVVIDVTPDAGKAAQYNRLEVMRDPSHGHAHSVDELEALGASFPLGAARVQSRLTGPLSFEAILETSFPDEHSREELYALMHEDALSGEDRLGFRAAIDNGKVMVNYAMSTIIWDRA